MADVLLAVATRTELGSGNAGRLRKEGKIPAVVYGRGNTPVSVTVDGRELRAALSGEAGVNALLNLDIDGTSHTALATQLQRHPTRGTVTHVDFQIVDRNQAISVDVPVELIGEADKVTGRGGRVIADLGTLTVNATPATIPQVIEVDITDLDLGQVIRVGELTLPNGVTTDTDPETPVVTGLPPRTAAADAAEDAAEAEAAGEGAGEGEGEASAEAGGDAEASAAEAAE